MDLDSKHPDLETPMTVREVLHWTVAEVSNSYIFKFLIQTVAVIINSYISKFWT